MGGKNVTKNAMGVPTFGTKRQTSVRIKYREMLTDVISSTSAAAGSWQAYTLGINPALSQASGGCFPWLSNIAQCFEEYVWHGLVFEFKSTSANTISNTTTALGEIILAGNYNTIVQAPTVPFASYQAMLQYEFSTSAKVSQNQIMGIECRRKDNPVDEFYTRTGPVPFGADPRLYDLATFTYAINGYPYQNVNLGQLWVCYDVELKKPKLPSGSGEGQINSVCFCFRLLKN